MRGKEKVDRSGYLFSSRDLTALLIPLVIEQLLSVLVGMADSIMVANVGEAAVSGVSLVDNIMVLLINVFSALATGGAVVAGQYLGRKDKEKSQTGCYTAYLVYYDLCSCDYRTDLSVQKLDSSWSVWKDRRGCHAACRHLSDDCGGICSVHCII